MNLSTSSSPSRPNLTPHIACLNALRFAFFRPMHLCLPFPFPLLAYTPALFCSRHTILFGPRPPVTTRAPMTYAHIRAALPPEQAETMQSCTPIYRRLPIG